MLRFALIVALIAPAITVDAAPAPAVAQWCLQAGFAQAPRASRRRPRSTEVEQAEADAKGTTDAAAVAEFWKRYDRVQTELRERRIPLPMITTGDARIAAVIDKAHVGWFYTEEGPTRYLAFHLQLGNETAQPVSVPRDRMHTVIDGNRHATQDIKDKLINQGFPYGGDFYSLEACQTAKELKAPPKGIAGTWLIYGGLPVTATAPACEVELQIGDRTLNVPVNAVQHALLDLTIEAIGPRRVLGLLTIGGLINTFNLYSLVDDFDDLTARKVNRVVVQWKPKTPLPESQLANWLQNSAMSTGSGRSVSEQLPSLPSAIRELHLVEPTPGSFMPPEYTTRPQGPPKVHASAADAVAAALRTLYLTLPRDELLTEVRSGHRLSRAAALVHGAPRLETSDVPLVVKLSHDTDPAVRRAALLALGDFEQPLALDRLEHALRKGDDADRAAATVGLSESRYRAVRDRFATILQSGDSALETLIVGLLAARPRPEWADMFVRHAVDDQGRLQIDMIRALVHLNDPRLVGLLAPTLQGRDQPLQGVAFQILAERHEERAEQLTAEYILSRLRERPPDATMMAVFARTKDPRAIPLLLRHLEGSGDKASLINLLGQIGDSPAGDAVIRHFDRFQPHEQVAALQTLRQLRHGRFVEIAGAALNSKQDMVVTHAAEGLSQQGGPEAERLLYEAFQKTTRPQSLTSLALKLANLGTNTSRQALQQARQSDYPPRKAAALAGLMQIRQNSPGWSHFEQGLAHAREEEWDDALESYKLAAQLDPHLPEAFAGQGDVHLRKQRYAEAEQAYGKAYQLDPSSGLSVSGLAIAQVLQERLEEGLATVEKVRAQFGQDVNFSYNVACVYGRAVEAVAKQPASAERDARLAKFRQQALDDLKQAVKLKFDDYEWMRKDPDLKSLHELPAFQELVREPK